MRWQKKEIPHPEKIEQLQKELGVSKLIARLLVLRGIRTFNEAKDFFRPDLQQLHSPFLMKDMEKAVRRILEATENGERILIFGDYDVDGTTAVSLMASYLRSFYPETDTYIPDRYAEGYGISYQGIDYAHDNDISLIIALDCGIKSVQHVQYAKEKGIDFIICDHHLPGKNIPDAVAVLDPQQADCSYPYKALCGCGVGFKLIQALHSTRNLPFSDLYVYLDLVAVAIAADIVPITGENRIMAYFGLQVLNQRTRPGFAALMRPFAVKEFTITDVVFKIAPRINAAGRIKHGNYAVQLLTEFNETEALVVAAEIDTFNAQRKDLDKHITEEALQQIYTLKEEDMFTTVVYESHWHKGVIGIVASRLIEHFYRPTLVFTKSGEVLAASARSVKNFDVYAALEACSEHLIQFGGHMYAAGMTLHKENYKAFKERFEEVVKNTIAKESLEEELEVDAEIDFNDLDEKTLRILKQFEPHGPGNRHPVFVTSGVFDTGNAQPVGHKNEHLRLFVKQNNSKGFPAIAFGKGDVYAETKNLQLMHLAFSLNENQWKDQVTLQLQVKDIHFSSQQEIFSESE